MSRTISASTRNRGPRASSRLSGSRASSSRRHVRRLPIGRRSHDQAVKMLEAPAVVHEFDGQPVEQFRMRRRLALRAEVFGRRHQAGAEVRLPDAIDDRAGRGRRAAIDQPAGEVEPRRAASSARSSGCRNAGTPGVTSSAGSRKSPRSSRCVSRGSSRSTSTSCVVPARMTLPQRLDPPIRFLPLGHGRPPVAEHASPSARRALGGWHRQDRRARRPAADRPTAFSARGDREAEAAEVVVLVVVAVPAAVILHELERQPHAAGSFERLLEHEHGLARHVAAAGADVDAPGRVVVAVDGITRSARSRAACPL